MLLHAGVVAKGGCSRGTAWLGAVTVGPEAGGEGCLGGRTGVVNLELPAKFVSKWTKVRRWRKSPRSVS